MTGHPSHLKTAISSFAAVVTTATVASTLPAQEWQRHVENLGAEGEAGTTAELALIELGANALPPLQDVLQRRDFADQRECRRLVAALRVIDVLGPKVAELQPDLGAILVDRQGKLRAPDKSTLAPEFLRAIGSTTPWNRETEFHNVFHFGVTGGTDDEKAIVMPLLYRFNDRRSAKVSDLEQAREELARDRVYRREAAAEVLGRDGGREDAERLRTRLLDREKQPDGWNELRNNGFVVPVTDRFALYAARALVALAPDDAISAIGYALVARDDPYRTNRVAAIKQLARFGPDCKDAVPELVAIAEGTDGALASEAIKILGMCGRAAGAHFGAIEKLTRAPDEQVRKRAGALTRMLGAMGFEAAAEPAADPDDAPQRKAVNAAVATLADRSVDDGDPAIGAAEAVLAELGKPAFRALCRRFQADGHECHDRVLRWIGRLGRDLPRPERVDLTYSLGTAGTTWSGPSFSSMSGGQPPSRARKLAYARLVIGQPSSLDELVDHLDHENAAVRLIAALDLAARAAEVAESESARSALWSAVTGDHPKRSPFQRDKHSTSEHPTRFDSEIRLHAAAALLETTQPRERHARLFTAVRDHPAAATVVAAIAAWGAGADAATLTELSRDERADVAAAARAALAQR